MWDTIGLLALLSIPFFTWEAEAGFYNGASSRLGAMLLGRDVSEPATAELPTVSGGEPLAGLRRSA